MKLPRLRLINKRGRGQSDTSSDAAPEDVSVAPIVPPEIEKATNRKGFFRGRISSEKSRQSNSSQTSFDQTSILSHHSSNNQRSSDSITNSVNTSSTFTNTSQTDIARVSQSSATTTGAVTSETPPKIASSLHIPSTKFPAQMGGNDERHTTRTMKLDLPKPYANSSNLFDLRFDKTASADREQPKLAESQLKKQSDQPKFPSFSPPPPLPEPSSLFSSPLPTSNATVPDVETKANSITTSQTSSRSRFSRRTFQDKATKIRRMLRERIPGTRTSCGASSTTLDDVPEAVDANELHGYSREVSSLEADEKIARFAESQRKENIKQSEKQKSRERKNRKKASVDNDSNLYEDVPRMPAEIPELQPCNDGTVAFNVPKGWVATRAKDSFCLSNGRSLGYVRSVNAQSAVDALMETKRLQVMSEIHALSSPVFGDNGEAVVNYFSHLGAGKGVAIFCGNVEDGACVFGLCGPTNEQDVIDRAIEDVKRSVRVVKVPTKKGVGQSMLKPDQLLSGASNVVIQDVDLKKSGGKEVAGDGSAAGAAAGEWMCIVQ